MSSFLQLCAHALVSVKATINIALVNNPNHMTQNKTNIHHLRETHLGSFTYSSSSSCVRGRCSTLSPIMMTTWFRHLLKLDQDVSIRGKRSLTSLLHYKLFYFIEEKFFLSYGYQSFIQRTKEWKLFCNVGVEMIASTYINAI